MPRVYVRNFCSIEECGREVHGNGYCRPHRSRWVRYGHPLLGKPVPLAAQQAKCTIDDCTRQLYLKGLCSIHYGRLRQHGDPLKVTLPSEIKHPARSPKKVMQDFTARLIRMPSGCLEWVGARSIHGYGRVEWEGRTQQTHRVAYSVFVGPIPNGLYVCHRCDNPPCCDPEHLFVGTVKDNHADMEGKGRGFVPEPGRGDEAKHSKLTSTQVKEIRDARSMGVRGTDLARQYGVSRSTISSVGMGKTWKHVA